MGTHVDFKTFYRAPDRFRLEWASHSDYKGRRTTIESVVWANGTGVHRYWTVEPHKVERYADLETALGGAAGVSGGASRTVPPLLLRLRSLDRGGGRVWRVGHLELLPSEEFDGTPCHRVRGTEGEDDVVDVWIGRDNFMIRRIVWTYPPDVLDGRLYQSEEIRRDIQVNVAIGDTTFEIDLPLPGVEVP
jgi:hypothetical protein